jgi:hypothetical protein
MITPKLRSKQMATSKVENSALAAEVCPCYNFKLKTRPKQFQVYLFFVVIYN